MSLYYENGFQVTTSGGASPMALTGTISVTMTAGLYAHQSMASLASVLGAGNYVAFGAALKALMDTAGGGPWTVTYSTTTHKYTVSRATTFSLTFTGAAGTNMRHVLGFSASQSGASTYTSDVIPYHVIVPAMQARSASLPFYYEPDDIVEEDVSDGGVPYAIAKQTTEKWSDWTQTMEAPAAVFNQFATSGVPWTYESMIEYVRGTYPIAVYETAVFNGAYKLRADSARFKPLPVVADWDQLYNLKFTTRYLGTLS